jgi:hypothetical protein
MAAKKNAQSSTEYLVILAVVVIIALAVVGVLGGFPTLTKGISTKDSLSYWQSADIGVEKPYLAKNTTLASLSSLVLRNNQNFGVTVTGISFGGDAAQNATVSGLPATLSPGQTQIVVMTTNDTNPCSSLNAVTSGVSSYSETVAITYSDAAAENNKYQFTGAKPLVGTCQ